MKKAHVFKYSQVIKTDRIAIITQFSQHSSIEPKNVGTIAINEERDGGIIDQYKTGKITTEEFRIEMNELIEEAGGKPITNLETFDKCWNAMCIVEPEKLAELYNLQQTHKFHIRIVGGTNELQHNYIQQEIQKASINPDISYTLSYELGTLDKKKLEHYTENVLKAQNYEPVWHTANQNDYDQNALEILGKHYDNTTTDII
ncbi:MAG: hypothetical protein ACEY3D_05160 [Rickettsia sp.]|uniref:hypothetical protein n=1 Tax=Rickettsia sp. TaxID=789 RepID=UPI00397B1226